MNCVVGNRDGERFVWERGWSYVKAYKAVGNREASIGK